MRSGWSGVWFLYGEMFERKTLALAMLQKEEGIVEKYEKMKIKGKFMRKNMGGQSGGFKAE